MLLGLAWWSDARGEVRACGDDTVSRARRVRSWRPSRSGTSPSWCRSTPSCSRTRPACSTRWRTRPSTRGTSLVLTDGTLMSMPPPPSYLPLWFGAQTPVVLGLALAGLRQGWPLGRGGSPSSARDPALAVDVPLAVGAASWRCLLMPVAGCQKAVLYDGTRQVLFVIPALAVSPRCRGLAGGAPCSPDRLASSRRGLDRGRRGPGGTDSVRISPVPLRRSPGSTPSRPARPIDGRWMTEYWRTSAREITPRCLRTGRRAAAHGWGASLRLGATQPQFSRTGRRGAASSQAAPSARASTG